MSSNTSEDNEKVYYYCSNYCYLILKLSENSVKKGTKFYYLLIDLDFEFYYDDFANYYFDFSLSILLIL